MMYLGVNVEGFEESRGGAPAFNCLEGYAVSDVIPIKETPE